MYCTISYLLVICALLIIDEFTSFPETVDFIDSVTEYLFVTLIVFPGLLPVYIPLYYIRECEGTLDAQKWKSNRHQLKHHVFRPKDRRSTSISPNLLNLDSTPLPPVKEEQFDKLDAHLDSLEAVHGGISSITPMGPSRELRPSIIRAAIKGLSINLRSDKTHNEVNEEEKDKESPDSVHSNSNHSNRSGVIVTACGDSKDAEQSDGHDYRSEQEMNTDSTKSKVIEAAESKANLFDFLKTHENYKSFASCLGHYFALENLLFIEKISVLYQVVRKLKHRAKENSARTSVSTVSILSAASNSNQSTQSAQSVASAASAMLVYCTGERVHGHFEGECPSKNHHIGYNE